MEILTKRVPNNFNLWLFGDQHIGSIMRHASGWNTLIDMMNSSWNGVSAKYNYGIDHGDFCEAITIDDPRFDIRTTTQSIPAQQIVDATEIYKPIRNKLVVMLDGNHPMKLWKYDYMTPRLCHELNIPFGTLACKVHWLDRNGDLMFKSWHNHGRKGISSIAGPPARRLTNMHIALQNHLWAKAGDCFLMCRGHTHKLLVMPPTPEVTLYDNERVELNKYTTSYTDQAAEYIGKDDRWYVSTGSFLKLRDVSKRIVYMGKSIGVSGYAEAADYDPMELGFAVAEIRGRKLVEVRKIKLLSDGIEVDPPIG